MKISNRVKIERMAGIALLSAIIVVLQLLAGSIRIGPVSFSLVLIPIVVGAAIYGPTVGAILGAVFSIVVIAQPDTQLFHGITVFGTIVTVFAKGILSGLCAGLTYRLISRKSEIAAIIASAVVCPVVNTGVFFLGCRVFFWSGLAEEYGVAANRMMTFFITTFIGVNFLVELAVNLVVCPGIATVLRAVRRNRRA